MKFLLLGEDQFLLENAIFNIIKDYPNHEVKKIKLENKMAMPELFHSLDAYNLFNDKSIIIIDEPFFLNEKYEDATLLESLKESNHVIIIKASLYKKNLKFFKELNKFFKLSEFPKLNDFSFKNEAKKLIKLNNIKIDSNSLDYLLNNIDNDLYILSKEIKKMVLYNAPIDKKYIDNNINFVLKNNIFHLINAIFTGDIDNVINIYRKLIKNTNFMLIIYTLASELRQVLLIQKMRLKYSLSEIKEILKLNDYRFNKLLNLAQNKIINVAHFLASIHDFEYNFKNGNIINENDYLELLILEEFAYEFN